MTEWTEPWAPVDDDAESARLRAGWERELRREIAPEHVLSGQDVRLLGLRRDCDDALFGLADGRVAVVHLTWKQALETDPRFPQTTLYPSLQDWSERAQRRDHAEWTGE